MIEIKIIKDDHEKSVTLISKGHAGVDAAGADPVCAAVSSHIYGIGKQLSLISVKKLDARTISVGERDGEAFLWVACKKNRLYMKLHDYLAPTERSFELLQQHYPEAIKVIRIRKA